jgi:hypothetical protein
MLTRILRRGAQKDSDAYRPGHDLFNYAPSAVRTMLAMLRESVSSWPRWLRLHCQKYGIERTDVAAASIKFAAAIRMVTDDPQARDIAECFQRSGFDSVPEPTRIVYFALFGQLMLGGLWTASHLNSELPRIGPDPGQDPEVLARAARASIQRLDTE